MVTINPSYYQRFYVSASPKEKEVIAKRMKVLDLLRDGFGTAHIRRKLMVSPNCIHMAQHLLDPIKYKKPL